MVIMERLITLTPEQIERVTDLASEKWINADVRNVHDVFDVLDLAKYVLNSEVPGIQAMKIDLLEAHGEDFRVHVWVDENFWLASSLRHVGEFDQRNGSPTGVAVEYLLGRLIDIHNKLINRFKEGL